MNYDYVSIIARACIDAAACSTDFICFLMASLIEMSHIDLDINMTTIYGNYNNFHKV